METEQVSLQGTELKLSVPWGHIAAKAWGSDQGERVLMVHGFMDNAATFDRLMPYLPKHYYYVAIDLPGHGFSSHFPAGISLLFYHYTYVIGLVLDLLKWESCIYIGHSLGARLGLFCDVIFPNKFKKLILLDIIAIPHFNLIDYLQSLYKIVNKKDTKLHTYEEALHSMQSKRLSFLKLDAAKALFSRAVTPRGDKYKYNRDIRLIFSLIPLNDVFLEIISMNSSPIFLISCRRSVELSSKEIIDLAASKKNIKIVILDETHDMHNNYPERVGPYICDYLADIPQSKL